MPFFRANFIVEFNVLAICGGVENISILTFKPLSCKI